MDTRALESRREQAVKKWRTLEANQAPVVYVGVGTCGRAAGAEGVIEVALDALGAEGQVVQVGCIGPCYLEPLMDVKLPGKPRVGWSNVKPGRARNIINEYVDTGKPPASGLVGHLGELGEMDGIPHFFDHPMLKSQVRIALRNCGIIDPGQIDHYLARGGYTAVCKALAMSPEDVIAEIDRAGLRGRGGGGFPTGRKWRSCRKAPGDRRFVVCNADEGDPGAFMDRSIMEGDPHSVIEGMIIGAWAVGSHEGHVYIRLEYPLALKHLKIALEQARECGLLGERILGSEFSFDIHITRGGGAFVCGESSALMRSLEGKVGEPRAKYIHSVEKGLWDLPTVLNNVETWANVPYIIDQGADRFASIGTEKSKGTKVFSLVGKVKNTGLVEVPMGMTLREIIYGIGGGVAGDRPFKAVQTGGPSGGCLPADSLDEPVDFDNLTRLGSMMGSGGMIVMDDRSCMVDVARYFVKFLIEESCGKCVPCREGLVHLHRLLDDVCNGRGEPGIIEQIEEICWMLKNASLCELGRSAPNPVLSTLRYFRDEWVAHIEQKKCVAGVCPALTEFVIQEDACIGCQLCMKHCPADAISGEKKQPHIIDADKCVSCGVCRDVCPTDAVKAEQKENDASYNRRN